MMNAAGVDQHCPGAYRQFSDDPFTAPLQGFFHIALKDVVLSDRNGRKPVHGIHLGSGQHHASEAAGGTDEHLVGFGHQGTDVNNIPDPAHRRRVGKADVGIVFICHIADKLIFFHLVAPLRFPLL